METTIMAPPREFRTGDLALATFLNLGGHKHRRLEMKEDQKAEWVFEYTPGCKTDVRIYKGGRAAVEPLDFAKRLRVIRNELYQFVDAHRRA